MKQFHLYFIPMFFALCFLASCSPIYYNQGRAVSPDLEEKGDIVLTGNLTRAEPITGGIELAGSPVNHIGLIVRAENYYYGYTQKTLIGTAFPGIPLYEVTPRNISNQLFSFGAGYYTEFADKYKFQIYSTIGTGSFKDGSFKGNYSKLGIHPSIIIPIWKLELGFHGSWNYLEFRDLKNDFILEEVSQYEYLNSQRKHQIGELHFTIKYPFKSITLFQQIGGSENYSHEEFRQSEIFGTSGISVNLNSLFSK